MGNQDVAKLQAELKLAYRNVEALQCGLEVVVKELQAANSRIAELEQSK